MQHYQIEIAEIGTFVKFKVLSPEDVESFVDSASELPRDDYMKAVIETLVFNFKTEIIESLKMMSRSAASTTLEALYNGCVMLNPGLDVETWVRISFAGIEKKETTGEIEPTDFMPNLEKIVKALPGKKPTKTKFLNLEKHLKDRIIGQDHAIEAVVSALRRSQAGLSDDQRPLGVFLFAGSSGVGKSYFAKELHKYLFSNEYDIVRIDCGEFQHKHENQKLMGSPPGYVGHEDGGQLTNQIEKNPQTVVLLDEVEKAHPDLWHTFLRVFDEGILTSNKGKQISFRDAIIIMTTNLGNEKVVDSLIGKGVGFSQRIEDLETTIVTPPHAQVNRLAREAIRKNFKPELLNRLDQIIVFNHLSNEDFKRVASLELEIVDDKLSKKGNSLQYSDDALQLLVDKGVDTVRGARGMAQVRREQIEAKIADLLLESKCPRGTIFHLTTAGKQFEVSANRPQKAIKAKSE